MSKYSNTIELAPTSRYNGLRGLGIIPPMGPAVGVTPTGGTTPPAGDATSTTIRPQRGDCPPQENCTEKWVEKILYVSAQPQSGAIEIPVAFEKLICEGESQEDPQIDCDELLEALQQSVDEGGVPGMMNGLSSTIFNADLPPLGVPTLGPAGTVTPPPPDDWCQNCTTKLVKAVAYVTDSPGTNSKPFKVKIKVLVCETDANPKIDCAEVITALKTGMKAGGIKALSGLRGLSNASTTTSPAFSAGSAVAQAGRNFDEEALRLDQTQEGQYQVQEAGMPWWGWAIIAGAGLYAVKNVMK